MERLRPPPPFDFDDENVKKNWRVWEKHFRYYLVATECDEKADKIKVAVLLSCIGIRGREIYDKLEFDFEEQKNDLNAVLKKFEEYKPHNKDTAVYRQKFFKCRQHTGQSFGSYVKKLQKVADYCDFGHLRDSLVKDTLVTGVKDAKLKEKMLRDTNMSLSRAIQVGLLFWMREASSKRVGQSVSHTSFTNL